MFVLFLPQRCVWVCGCVGVCVCVDVGVVTASNGAVTLLATSKVVRECVCVCARVCACACVCVRMMQH